MIDPSDRKVTKPRS